MVSGKQFTVSWHVNDDQKISQKDKDECVTEKHADDAITKHRPSKGKVHDCLGMT